MKKEKIKEYAVDFFVVLTACVFYGLGVNVFVIPNNLVQGGIMGLAVLINRLFPVIGAGALTLILNIPIFIVAFRKIGGIFILKSFITTVMMSFFIDFFSFLPKYSGEMIIVSLFGGLVSGISLALIFIRGATTGGTDIIAKLFRIKFPNMTMGKVVMFLDFVVIILSAVLTRKIENALFSAILIFVSAYFIDYFIYGASHSKLLLIITTKHEAVSEKITLEMKRGHTIVPIEGGYTKQAKKMIICAVRSSEAVKLNKIIRSCDPDAFTIITDAGEIIGQGFRNNE